MTHQIADSSAGIGAKEPIESAAGLLGGTSLLKRRVRTMIDVHDVVEEGIPSRAFHHLIDQVKVIEAGEVQKAVGISVRTAQRRSHTPRKPLTAGQSGRAWQFAQILARSAEVFGTQKAGEEWLLRPAMALGQRRPIDLLSTAAGAGMVERLLGRIEYGVYT